MTFLTIICWTGLVIGSLLEIEPDLGGQFGGCRFHFAEGRADVAHQSLASKFDRHHRRLAADMGEETRLERQEVFGFRLEGALERRRHRREEAVGDEDAEEGADERAADQMSQHLRRLLDRPHRLDHAEHGGDDAERRCSVGDRLHGRNETLLLLVVRLQFLVHERVDLVGVVGAQRQHAHVVADELDCMMVRGKCREGIEQRRLFRIFNVLLDGEHALLLHELVQRILHPQQFDIAFLRVLGALHDRAEHGGHGLEDRRGIADDEGTDRCAEDDDELERLPEDLEVATHGRVTAEDADEDNDCADDQPHGVSPSHRSSYSPREATTHPRK
ncbi:hypothetical protein BOS5A_80090 [Bosea sp. EC-HK365B]|nr:hypothetical protein BOSE46_140082 [Bosea sp. 46]CAD5268572.1 hypothetical protein BOSE21B_111482 [Bosea sp. 21B]CAD5270044.1 hypothetical protein BOSE7B_20156 [Bosea sp. 7B]VVT62430.1 hypothetical protein BOS5A_80090 [Bosea sp. EC-HK365B]VXC38206.1 hypothetical protein BOSE125_200050 [Bosea sp. 125]